MRVELGSEEIEALIEGLDCLKTKIAFTKGFPPSEKNEKIRKVEMLVLKLSSEKGSE